MDTPELLDEALAWTSARIAAVPVDGLDGPTPCSPWTLEDLLDHTIGSLTMLVDAVAESAATERSDAVDGGAPGSTTWDRAIADLADRSRVAWAAPGVMERSMELPMGTMPAPIVAGSILVEALVHGWDISQASGEAAAIPDALALPTLEFARQAIADADRGDNFASDLGRGETASDQLVAFLGRTPR
jgi:uncharacterized protein (TIGR03086 family)